MGGPVLSIELAEAVPAPAMERLRDFLVRSSGHFEENRAGEWDLGLHPASLGITDTGGVDGTRPVMVSLLGPGHGQATVFESEHEDSGDLQALLGFTPTHSVNVTAFSNRPVDHLVAALLTATVVDLIGGVAHAEIQEHQVPAMAALPGIIAAVTDPWPGAYGTAEFLRAWTRQPGFRLLK